MSKHARLGPSNHRWPHCPGSVREEAAYEDVSGPAAIDGTGSHLLLELCLQRNVRANSYDGQVIGVNDSDQPMGWLVGTERIERVQEGLDYVARRVKELEAQFPGANVAVTTESKSNPGAHVGRDDWYGTVDVTIAVTNSNAALFLEIIDYKDGRGWVDVRDNTQLIGYAGGKLKTDMDIPCRMTIVQPKTNPSVRYEDSDSVAIMQRIGRLGVAAAKTDDPNAPLISGDHCTWCKHGRAKNCTAKSEQTVKGVKSMFKPDDNIKEAEGKMLFEIVSQTFGDITQMSSEKLEELADAKAGLMEIFDRVDIEIQRRVDDPNDNTVTGYAMLPGKSKQAWNVSDEEIGKVLKGRRLKKADIFPAKLITPAAMQKLDCLTKDQKQSITDKYIDKKAGKDTLQKVRKMVAEKDTAEMFADVKPEISFL